MGMYDYLKIPAAMLPISDEDKNAIGEIGFGGWQTKDLDCMLTTAEIHEDGTISMRKFTYEFDDTKMNSLGFKGVLHEKDPQIVKLDITGAVRFYGYIFDDWYDFAALFDKGRLQSIVGGKDNAD